MVHQYGCNMVLDICSGSVHVVDDAVCDVIGFADKETHNVMLSLDVRKEIHDCLRVNYAGKGSYDRTVPKVQKLVENRGGKNYYMRGTFVSCSARASNALL